MAVPSGTYALCFAVPVAMLPLAVIEVLVFVTHANVGVASLSVPASTSVPLSVPVPSLKVWSISIALAVAETDIETVALLEFVVPSLALKVKLSGPVYPAFGV